jgi:hypothetical protein
MSHYYAQWISKDKVRTLRKAGGWKDGILLDSYKGFIMIQPADRQYGDGEVLSPDTADYELRPEWCTGEKPKLLEARRRLRLDANGVAQEPRQMPETWGKTNGHTRP